MPKAGKFKIILQINLHRKIIYLKTITFLVLAIGYSGKTEENDIELKVYENKLQQVIIS